MNTLTKEDIKKFIVKNDKTMTIEQMSLALNVSQPTLNSYRYWLDKKGELTVKELVNKSISKLDLLDAPQPTNKLCRSDKEEIEKDIIANFKDKDLMQKYKLSKATIFAYKKGLREKGLYTFYIKHKINKEEIEKAIIDGKKELEICSLFNVGTETIYKYKKQLSEKGLYTFKRKFKKEVEPIIETVVEIVDNNNYPNEKGKNKDKGRTKIHDYTTNIGLTLCLPHEKAIMEMGLIERVKQNNPKLLKDLRFEGYETNDETFFKACSFIGANRLPISMNQGSISQAIYKATPNYYANLYLDYCRTINAHADEIKYAVDNDIMQIDGIMATTFSRVRTNLKSGILADIFKTVDYSLFGSDQCQTELGIKLFFSKILNERYKLELTYNYRDVDENGKMTQPMMLVIIRRIA